MDALEKLIQTVPKALTHAIEVEEGIPLNEVTNFEEVVAEVVEQLNILKVCLYYSYLQENLLLRYI